MSEELRVAFPTDEHHPFSDDRARSVGLQITQDHKPNILVSGSDAIDFYSMSRFDKNPHRAVIYNLDVEIKTWRKSQKEWNSAAPDAKKYFIFGNHEQRLIKYQMKHPEIFDIEALRFHNLFGFADLDIRKAKNNEIIVAGQLLIKHGDVIRQNSGYTAKAELERERYSITTFSGHSHRGGVSYQTTRNGVVAGFEGFCLCDLTPEYVRNPNWQQGILLATCNPAWKIPQVEAIPFYNKGGKVYAHWRDKEYISE